MNTGTTGKCLVIDCDPGVDDALAILYAFHQNKYDRIIILTVAGNVGVNQTTANALRLMTLLAGRDDNDDKKISGKTVRVIRGCATSMDGMLPSAASVHGRDGMGEVPLRLIDKNSEIASATKLLKKIKDNIFESDLSAVEFFISLSRCQEGRYDLICTGPLTNIATALHAMQPEQQPEFWKHFNKVLFMGGAVNVPGNVTPYAEFNFYADPLGARIFLESWERHADGKKLYMVPLDITEKIALSWWEVNAKKNGSNITHRFVACMLQKYFFFHGLAANPVYYDNNKKGQKDSLEDAISESSHRIKLKEVPKWRRELAIKYKDKKIGGSSGVKALPKFCYLHDALAMYVLFELDRLQDTDFRKERIRVPRELGSVRGMSMSVTTRPRPIEALTDEPPKIHEDGTLVYIPDTDTFVGSNEKSFKAALIKAIKE